jgi:hypothetical protein
MPVIVDRAYEGNETPQLVLALDMVPVVPPKSNRVYPWRYDRALYKNAMKSSDCSVASRVIAASFLASRNWIACSSPLYVLRSSSKRSGSVNTP